MDGAGQHKYVEIVQHDPNDDAIKDKTNNGRGGRSNTKRSCPPSQRQECALCQHSFPKLQLEGRVLKMSVTRMQRKWKEEANGKSDHLFQHIKTVQDHLFRPSDYTLDKVCVFCLQYFHAGGIRGSIEKDIEKKSEEQREQKEQKEQKEQEEPQQMQVHSHGRQEEQGGHFPVHVPRMSCTVTKRSSSSNKYVRFSNYTACWSLNT